MNPRRSPASVRRFTLVDAMILIAAAAAGFGLVRGWLSLRSRIFHSQFLDIPPRLAGPRDWYTAARLVLLALTMAVIPLGLRRAGAPRLGRWFRPGMIVPIAVALAVVACLVDEHAFPLTLDLHYLFASPARWPLFVASEGVGVARMATAIGVAWLTLLLAGCWDREDDWVGRLGRALGFAWIGTCLGFRAYELVMYWAFDHVVT